MEALPQVQAGIARKVHAIILARERAAVKFNLLARGASIWYSSIMPINFAKRLSQPPAPPPEVPDLVLAVAGHPAPLVLTIGHSNRSLAELLQLLQVHGVRHLVDVRTVPRSRRHPHFNREALPAPLGERGIRYSHLAALGGLRRPRPDSENGALEEGAFRGYADHMATAGFDEGVRQLLALARELPPGQHLAVMCAEALPERCHRSLLADALLVRGAVVEDIIGAGPGPRSPRRLTPAARVEGTRVTYPPAQPGLPF